MKPGPSRPGAGGDETWSRVRLPNEPVASGGRRGLVETCDQGRRGREGGCGRCGRCGKVGSIARTVALRPARQAREPQSWQLLNPSKREPTPAFRVSAISARHRMTTLIEQQLLHCACLSQGVVRLVSVCVPRGPAHLVFVTSCAVTRHNVDVTARCPALKQVATTLLYRTRKSPTLMSTYV